MGTKRTLRAGLTLPPVDFNAHRAALSEKWNMSISAEKAMSELMYPKVFSDFMARQTSKGGALIRHLPTPVYIHGMVPSGPPAVLVVPCDSGNLEKTEINMTRVCPLKDGKRVVCFLIDGSIVHEISVKDRSGKFIYEGPMATPGDLSMVYVAILILLKCIFESVFLHRLGVPCLEWSKNCSLLLEILSRLVMFSALFPR